MMNDRFVCVVNRDRDGYNVPRALAEAGLLDRFVTDFYVPASLRPLMPARFAKRYSEGLPSRLVRTVTSSFVVQTLGQRSQAWEHRGFVLSDALLARAGARIAGRLGAHLYCYSSYLPAEHLIAPGTRRIVFEYHPLPGLTIDILTEDVARFPEASWSYAMERRDTQEDHDAWRRADAVVCASGMTRDTLVHAGCDPSRIAVVPYGFELPTSDRNDVTPRSSSDACEFLFVGQGVQRKGLHHLIRAWQDANLADARLTLVCWRIDPGIRNLIRSPTIRLLERQPRETLERMYEEADVFVMPSLIEGFGLVYLEALARGCFAIGTRNTGLSDLDLPDDVAALLPAGDLAALGAALTAARDRKRTSGFDRAAVCRAATRWQWRDFRRAIGAHASSVLE